MERFLIISSHTEEDCHMAMEYFAKYNAGFLTQFEWGCFDNDHHAYCFIEADSPESAIMAVPPLLRSKAKAIKMAHFSPRNVDTDVHQHHV
jgi:hypothetical protein